MEYVKMPEDRIGAIIGKEGEVKLRIERELEVKLNVNAGEGVVSIERTGGDPLAEWKARDVVRAITYGISPDVALKLKSDEYALILINLCDIVGRSRKALIRQRGRIIGRKGKAKAHISELTGAAISVRGKHVAIVGRAEEAAAARDAVEAIAEGLPHSVVYRSLERRCSEMRLQKSVELWRRR